MPYAVTPLLWVGNDFPPDISGPKTLMPDLEDPRLAVTLIKYGTTVIVPHTHQAKRILRAMGMSKEDVDDRIKHGMRGDW